MIKGSIQQKNIKTLCLYAPNRTSSKYIIQKVKKKLNGEIDKYTNIIGISDVSFSVSEI